MHRLTLFLSPLKTHIYYKDTHTDSDPFLEQNELSVSREPEAKVQLKPFVMCHTALPKLGQLYAL